MPRKRKIDPDGNRHKIEHFTDVKLALTRWLVENDPKYMKGQEYLSAHRPHRKQQPTTNNR